MPSHWQIESVLSRIQSIRTEIERVAAKDHPYAEPGIVYSALLLVLDRSEKKVTQALSLYPKNPTLGDRATVVTLETEDKVLQDVAAIFNLADRVDSARIPFEIIRALSWAAKSLLQARCHTIIRLDTVYTYSIWSCREKFEEKDFGRQWRLAVEEIGSSIEDPVPLLGFPSTAAGSTLLHAIAAHEFAHVLKNERKSDISRKLDGLAISLTTNRCNSSADALDGYARDTTIRRPGVSEKEALKLRRDQLEDSIKVAVRFWFSEVFCDLVAARLVGPAFLAALDRLTPTSADSPSLTHPPISVRRSLVSDYLQTEIPNLPLDDVWQDVLRSVTAGDDIDLPWIICEEVITEGAPKISQIVNEVIISSPFGWVTDLNAFLASVEESLEYLSPPSAGLKLAGNVEDANYFWLLMFAAWRFRLTPKKFEGFKQTYGWTERKAEEALSNLLLHSLQSIELRSRWLEKYGTGLLATAKTT